MRHRSSLERFTGMALVVSFHAAIFYGLWTAVLIASPREATTLFVNFLAPPDAPKAPEPKRLPEVKIKPRPVKLPPTRQLVAQLVPNVPAAPELPQVPIPPEPIQAPVMPAVPAPASAPIPAGPIALSSELSVTCPQRQAPSYPGISRRLGEAGAVVLRVELSETGQVAIAMVHTSSGFHRLDEAALAAVRSWHCTPPTRNGQSVRATALQPFNFVIQGN